MFHDLGISILWRLGGDTEMNIEFTGRVTGERNGIVTVLAEIARYIVSCWRRI